MNDESKEIVQEIKPQVTTKSLGQSNLCMLQIGSTDAKKVVRKLIKTLFAIFRRSSEIIIEIPSASFWSDRCHFVTYIK